MFDVPRLYYNEQSIELQEFKAIWNVDFVYYFEHNHFCIKLYSTVENVVVQWKMSMKFQECLIEILSCIFNFSRWTDYDAKWFSRCSQSSQEYITMVDYTLQVEDRYVLGSDDQTASALAATDEECWPKIIDWSDMAVIGSIVDYFFPTQKGSHPFKLNSPSQQQRMAV